MGSALSVKRKSDTNGLGAVRKRTLERMGSIATQGRYHRKPRTIEDDYEMERKVLGTGYNGSVFLAMSKDTQKREKYAVKAFKLHGVTAEKKLELESECEIFLSVDHPHIVRLVDVYESSDTLDLVMECMEGGELFKRVLEKKRFSEKAAADATWQMLLAVRYLHSRDIVHRDLKLENFLFDKPDSDHLKLIDFGFSKIWQPNTKMALSCGTLAYVAPEVLAKSYTSQCDMWSLGVVVFIVVFGYMPFAGNEPKMVTQISKAKYCVKNEVWKAVSKQGQDFVKKLLVKDPQERLTAQAAMDHAWLSERAHLNDGAAANANIVDSLTEFAHASAFRRASMELMAWSLTSEEREKVEAAFLEIDTNKTGAISMSEFSTFLQANFHMDDQHATVLINEAFDSFDQNHDHLIHYTEFLAAMVGSRIKLHDGLLKQAFRRFDLDKTGYISRANLKEVMGDSIDDKGLEEMMKEADENSDGKIDYEEYMHYFSCGSCKEHHAHAAAAVIDNVLAADENHTKKKRLRLHTGVFHGHHEFKLPLRKPDFHFKRSGSSSSSNQGTPAGAAAESGAEARPGPMSKPDKKLMLGRSAEFWWGTGACCILTLVLATIVVVVLLVTPEP